MFRYRIRLDTGKEVQDFVNRCSKGFGKVVLEGVDEDGTQCTVSAHSLIGAMYAMQWDAIYCVSDHEIYHAIKDYVL